MSDKNYLLKDNFELRADCDWPEEEIAKMVPRLKVHTLLVKHYKLGVLSAKQSECMQIFQDGGSGYKIGEHGMFWLELPTTVATTQVTILD